MEILKYLDVLIGLAVVMVLLSPLVSGFTQFWMWAFNVRAGRLRVGLSKLIEQLDADAFESFDAIAISGLNAGAEVKFQQPPGIDLIVAKADTQGNLVLTQNIAAMLRLAGGNLEKEIQGVPVLAVPAIPKPRIRLWVRGTEQTLRITSQPTDASGDASVPYRFSGPAQFSGYQGLANVPDGATLTITVASGDFQGTPVDWDATTHSFSYPAHMRPVPAAHDLKLHLSNVSGPVKDFPVTLVFDRNTSAHPVEMPAPLTAKDAGKIATAVLLHPMIAQPTFLLVKKARKGEVVEREELIRILLEFAARPATPEQEKLRRILALDGVPEPARAMADIRSVAQQLELSASGLASHERLSRAILMAAQSSFVGRINNWFDQTMERTIVEYKFRAQLVTIAGAALVATFVQLDSIDLLKRLSTDDKLRESLVTQAEQQQKNLDDQAKLPKQDPDEVQLARARREEIEANLAKLRDPQLGILPDHFIWQPLPEAHLTWNAEWAPPYSQRLELVAGSGVYPVEPRWTSDVLSDIEESIRNSGAPVRMSRERHYQHVVRSAGASGGDIENLHIRVRGADRLTHFNGFAQAKISDPASKGTFELIVGYEPPVTITTTATTDLKAAINASSAPVSMMESSTLRAVKRDARWIYLRRRPQDPDTNILQSTEIVDGSGRFDDPLLTESKDKCEIAIGDVQGSRIDCNSLPQALKDRKFDVNKESVDQLVITSQRLGALQLRYVPSKPDTNMLISDPGPWISFDADLLSHSWRGVLLTWVLLSLGAPFWYDALKDLLKLRSSLAKQEEDARNDRKSKTGPTATAESPADPKA